MPCVGQTTSTNEWQQQSGGMILRRGSVVVAFLLCFLAEVRGFFWRKLTRGKVTRFSRLDVLWLHECRLKKKKKEVHANVMRDHASAIKNK